MLNRVIEQARAVPGRLSHGRRRATHVAHVRLHHTRVEGEERLWALQLRALEQAGELLDKSPEVVGLRYLRTTAARVVERGMDSATTLPEGYPELNARDAVKLVRDLEHLPLLRVRHWELENKARKTVLAAIDKRRAQLLRVPEPVWTGGEAAEE